MPRGCQTVEQHQLELLLRELPSGQHNLIQQHLERCAHCTERVARVRALLHALSTLKPLPASQARRQEVMRRLGSGSAVQARPQQIGVRDDAVRTRRAGAMLPTLLGLLVAAGAFALVADIGGVRQRLMGVEDVARTRLRPSVPGPGQEDGGEGVASPPPAKAGPVAAQTLAQDLDQLTAELRARPVAQRLGPVALGRAENRLLKADRARLVASLDDPVRQLAAIAVLSRLPPGTGAKKLRALLDASGAPVAVRRLSLRTLTVWRDRAALRLSAALLGAPQTPSQLSALAGRAQAALIRDPSALSALLFSLQDPAVAAQLAQAIGELGRAASLAHFDLRLRSETRMRHRLRAARVLLASGTRAVRTTIEGLLNSGEDALFRYRLLELLVGREALWIGTLQALALNDQSAHIRALSLRGLSRVAELRPERREEVSRFMLERLRAARSVEEVYWAARHMGAAAEVGRELEGLLNGSAGQQVAVLRNLVRLKSDRHWGEVSRLAASGEGRVRGEAMLALGRAGRSRARLVEFVGDPDPTVSAMAALGLHLQGVRTTHIKAAVAGALARPVTVLDLRPWTVKGLQAYLKRVWRIKLVCGGEQAVRTQAARLPEPRRIAEPIQSLLNRFAEQHGLRVEHEGGLVRIQ